MIKIHNFLKKILIAGVAIFLTTPVFAGIGEVGDYGMWATSHNQELVNNQISDELTRFGPGPTVSSVPIDAKLGLAFMGGMAKIGNALIPPLNSNSSQASFVNFIVLFMLLAYAFWVAFEAYNLSISSGDAKKALKDVITTGIWISVWIIILKMGIAEYFAMIMVPIISVGAFISSFILDATTSISGIQLENHCDAIKNYAVMYTPRDLQITATSAAELLCIPSQMSNFFMTTMKIGWQWVINGVGVSLFSVLVGLYVTYLSLKCIWKYLFIALGVIADIFLALMLLPFTAIAETTAKTNYKGVAGDIFNTFLSIFKAEKLETQINRIVKAAVYFICLAIAIGVSLSLMSFIIDPRTGSFTPPQGMNDFLGGSIILILTLLLVCYIADKSESLAEKWGGKIDAGIGQDVQKDVKKVWDTAKKRWKQLKNLKK